MAQLQYIGARYVPVWYHNSVDDTSNWEINVEYEPLTWVTTPNNHLYLSKKTVPDNVGTPADNTEYWLDMGVFSGGGGDLDGRVTTLEDKVATIEDETIPAIDERLDALEALEDHDDWLIVTDSYGGLYPDTSGTTFIEHMRAFSGRDENTLIGVWKSGIGFCKSADGKVFQSIVSDYVATITEDKKKSIKKIIVAAGRNDYEYTHSEITNAIDSFATYCRSQFPNAELFIAFVANGNNTNAGTRVQQYTVYKAFNEQNSMTYLGGCEAILKNTDLMASDYIHPNANGRVMLARYLLQAITTGAAHVYYPRRKATMTYTLSGASGAFCAGEFYEEIIDGKLVLTQDANIGGVDFGSGSIAANGGNSNILGISDAKYIKFPVQDIKLPMVYSCIRTSASTGMDTDGVYTCEISQKSDGNIYLGTFGSVSASPYNRTITYILFGRGEVELPAVLA